MSLATLAARLYTVKSRKNLSISTAFVSLVREDLAMRFSVFNMVRAVTGSDFIATLIQSKYGRRTPIEREEAAQQKRKYSEDRKFKQFTLDSIVTLNNKINTLTTLTERNTALILNLYNDLGFFKGQRRDTVSQINSLSAVRVKIKSRTVKYQIDQLRAEMDALQQITVGRNLSKRIKNAAVAGGGAAMFGAGAAGSGAGSKPNQSEQTKSDKTDTDAGAEEEDLSLIDKIFLGLAAKDAAGMLRRGYRFIRRKYFPTPGAGTATPVKPTPTTSATKAPVLDKRLKSSGSQYRDPKTGRITKAPAPTATKPPPAPSSGMTALRGLGGRIFGALGTAGRILGTGPQTIATIMGGAAYMASGEAGEDIANEMQKRVKPFGIKIIPTRNGTLYEINGVTYTSENLPPEYQTILDAYAIDDRSASSRAAKQRIQAAPALYNSLIVEGPPLFAESDTAMRVIAAAKAAQINVPEPVIPANTVASPEPTSTVPTLPSVSYTPGQPVGIETVKQIIVHAASIVGVDPGIMLAMGQQESSFNPNARPIDRKTGKLLSSAKGLFQFIDSTWNEMLKKYSKEYPELNRGPLDPLANALAGALYVKENSAYLRKNKIPVTGTSIYATHFLGPGGATKLFAASKDSPAVAVLPDAAASNPFIFKNRDGSSKTVGEVIDMLYFKVGKRAETFTAELRAKPPALEYDSGMPVATLPVIAATSASTSSASSVNAEVKSEAALQMNKTMQSAIATVASTLSDMKKQTDLDSKFPSVRNQAFTPA